MAEFDSGNKVSYMPAYEGASTSYRMEQKGLQLGDQDELSARELKNLWQRSHYLSRNNAIGATAKHRLVSNWIGNGIKIRWMNQNGTPAEKVQKEWELWCSECTIDGHGDFRNYQKEFAGALMESGEGLSRMYINRRKKSKIPLALQNIEAEQLDPLYSIFDKSIRTGISFDEFGKPTIYHLWKHHPGAYRQISDGNKRVEVPADDMIHAFERLRPGQWRGIPWLTPVMLNIYEIDELVDATLQRQKAAQAMSWIIENTNPVAAFAPGSVRSAMSDTDIDPATKQKRKIIQGSAGSVHYLNKGESFKFASIQDIGPNLSTLLQDEMGKIAACLGLTYDQLTGDLSQVNFSSIRAGLNEFRVRTEIIQRFIIINLALLPIANRWLELFAIYVPRIGTAGVYPLFTLPRRYGVDELKDAQADLMEVQAGFSTMERKLEERDVTFQEIIADRKRAEASGFIFTSIPEPAIPATSAVQPNKVNDQTTPKNTSGA